jgi:3-oxoacyl-[acyl-carrier protein] reductase
LPAATCDSGSDGNFAKQLGTAINAMPTRMANTALLKRLPTLDNVANFAAFVTSEQAGAMTRAIVNLTGSSIVA